MKQHLLFLNLPMSVTPGVLQLAPTQLLQEHLFAWLVSSTASNKDNLRAFWQLAGHLFPHIILFLFFSFFYSLFVCLFSFSVEVFHHDRFFSKLRWIIPHFSTFPLEMFFYLPFPVFYLNFFFSSTIYFLGSL